MLVEAEKASDSCFRCFVASVESVAIGTTDVAGKAWVLLRKLKLAPCFGQVRAYAFSCCIVHEPVLQQRPMLYCWDGTLKAFTLSIEASNILFEADSVST